MNRKPRWMIAAAVLLSFATGVWAEQAREKPHPQTLKNLDTAMRGEAFAHVKYRLFARRARQAGHDEVARQFATAAEAERFDHFTKEAQLSGLIRGDADNLRDANAGESYEVDVMYKQFAEQARAVGDTAAADLFEEIRRDEMQHRDAFKALLEKLEAQPAGHM
jgi:rubrerythrin